MFTGKVDQRRLNDGAAAMALGKANTEAEIKSQIEQLHDAIAAMQSLDDLGSPEANDAAMKDHDALLNKLESLERKLKKVQKSKK